MVKFLRKESAVFARKGGPVRRAGSGAGRCRLKFAQGQCGVHTLLLFR